jgi:hypothetical protein
MSSSITLFDEYAALQKRFGQNDQVSRTFTADAYSQVDADLIDAYENSGRYTVSESGGSVTVTSVPVGWNGVGTNDAGNFEQLRLVPFHRRVQGLLGHDDLRGGSSGRPSTHSTHLQCGGVVALRSEGL